MENTNESLPVPNLPPRGLDFADYQALVASSPEAILVECDERLIFANPAALRLLGATHPATLLGRSFASLATISCQQGLMPLPEGEGLDLHAQEQQLQRLDGTLLEAATVRAPFSARGRAMTQIVVHDISCLKQREALLQHRATHDALTGLPNRSLLVDRLHQAIAEAKRYGERFTVVFIDLDRFKWINDSYGHEVGDILLKTVSERMSDCLRESDTIARIGGDEFVLLLRDSRAGDDPQQVIKRVVSCVSSPLSVNGQELHVTCSMGCCTYPEDGADPDTLLRFSDAAMYRAKEIGRNNVQHYDADLRRLAQERVQLGNELRQAVEREEFRLFYQLQIDLRSGEIMGIEALLRWQHPRLGLLEPLRFLSIAEETGHIERIDEWVMREACRQNRRWQEAGLAPVRIAVNLSARELARPGLEERIARSLQEAQLDPGWLELEVTETASMHRPDTVLPLMHRLKDLGICLSIDDFGTGYSNIQYLQRFPVDKLKLDGSFVNDIATDSGSLAITDAIVNLAHRLGMKVVAEMAETESQINLLTACGCDQVQGHYYSAPVDAEDCGVLLRQGRLPLSARLQPLPAAVTSSASTSASSSVLM